MMGNERWLKEHLEEEYCAECVKEKAKIHGFEVKSKRKYVNHDECYECGTVDFIAKLKKYLKV